MRRRAVDGAGPRFVKHQCAPVHDARKYGRRVTSLIVNLVFIAEVSIQDYIICNPARCTFGQKDLVAELDRGPTASVRRAASIFAPLHIKYSVVGK
jgi:hypothetical protein